MLENKLAIASVSLGQHASHTLDSKIVAAADAGFDGIEVTFPDLESYAKSISVDILEAAHQIRDLSKNHHISILAFASFQNFEGNKSSIHERLETAKYWLSIARALNAQHLQIPAIYIRDINDDHDLMISELRQLADLAAASKPVIKVAYENLAWSTRVIFWQDALQFVQEVNRPNFGLCLDTFHISVALWADAFNSSGYQADGNKRLAQSMHEFVEKCPLEKIFYIQISDGEPMDPPYSEKHPWYDATLEPGHVWSNEARPFPLETNHGAYMPVLKITQAMVVDKSFTGWISLETFDRRMRDEQNGPTENAQRGMSAWQNLRKRLSSTDL